MSKLSARLRSKQACLMYWAIVCALCVGVGACSDSALTRPEASDNGEASFVVSSKIIAATLSRAEVVITGSNMDEIRQDLTIDENVIAGTVQNIPAGNERRFTLNGYDSSGNLVYSGSAMADVVAGEQVAVKITMSKQGDAIYWITTSEALYRTTFDGLQEVRIVDISPSHSLLLSGMAIDVGGGKIYWTEGNPGAGKIQRANLDGSQIEDLVVALYRPRGLFLDISSGKIYWIDGSTTVSAGKIRRANLDGSQIEDLVSGLTAPSGMAIDVGGGKIYWTDTNEDKIQRANLDGSQIEDLVVKQNKVDDLTALILDVGGGKMYWLQSNGVRRANLDGSQIEDIVVAGSIEAFALYVGNRSE